MVYEYYMYDAYYFWDEANAVIQYIRAEKSGISLEWS